MLKGNFSWMSEGIYELTLTGTESFPKELAITVTVTNPTAYIPIPTREVVLKFLYEIVAPTAPDLLVKFGIKPVSYSSHNVADIKDAFYALHCYINDTTKFNSSTISDTIGNVVHLGDYIDLVSLTVSADTGGGGVYEASNTVLSSGTLLRLTVVGINSFNRRGEQPTDYVDTPHVVFQFQNVPGIRRANNGRNITTGYKNSEMRSYIINKYLPGLKTAGVSDDWLFAPKRKIHYNGTGTADVLEDLLWLPTERELFYTANYSYSSETANNQAYLEYYNDATKRVKYNKSGTAVIYWEASPYYNDAFCSVSTLGSFTANWTDDVVGVAPAFCIK
jgi:hypothetical protein